MRGNCYVASEALYHILGGKGAGWKPMRLRVGNDTHWFLQHSCGLVLDASRNQFAGQRVRYQEARGSGFLTKKPSKRAVALIERLTWQ